MQHLSKLVVFAILALSMNSFANINIPSDICQGFDSEMACQKLSGGKCAWDEEMEACQSILKVQHHHHCYHHCHYMCEQDHHCFWSHYEGACYPR